MIIWFTGQPHSGKTTLAGLLKKGMEDLYAHHTSLKFNFFHIDGDNIRELMQNADYSDAGRRKNIEIAQSLALYLVAQSPYNIVIVSLVSPFIDMREYLKSRTLVKEIYCHTTDIRGRESFHVSDYQMPESDFLDLDTTCVDELTTLNEVFKFCFPDFIKLAK